MPTFRYVAIDAGTGRKLAGKLDGPNEEAAINELQARGFHLTRLEPAADPSAAGSAASLHRIRRGRAIGRNQVMLFTRQLAALSAAGMPLVRGLDLLARQERHPRWGQLIAGIADRIRCGGSLAEALALHPQVFSPLYLGMVRAAETGGTLAVVLERLARHLERSAQIRARLRAAMTYPLIILATAVAIIAALLTYVVPKFERIFLDVLKGAPLPGLTQVVLSASRFVQHHWLVLLAALGLSVAAVGGWGRTAAGRRLLDRLALRLPLLGPLCLKVAVARFARTLGTMLASGVPILPALQLTRAAAGNGQLADGIDWVHRRVREGENLAPMLTEAGVFPAVSIGMISVGEETGTLPAMLGRLADLYEEEVDLGIATLTSLIEPVMIVVMAIAVGTIVIALFLPIVRIIQLLT